ncbi:hypothetical protein [Bremerella sp. P1]|uniref:hypothetical protein n=1 Tax=Bremerella sp. P1 TaxID=3026424 RepID=UPI002367DC71|nr:hypothetical protein [Bremerella sp. P1]WDI43433.1 hypothetical protein PSR63_05670 [Bremerella sp. P1]
MTKPTSKAIAKTILNTHGETYAHQAGIRLRDAPAPLFQLLCESLLLSSRIEADQAVQATTALKQADLTTPRKMVEASWQKRVDVIAKHGHRRFDSRGSKQLGQTADLVLKRYYGDLRQLRAEAHHDVAQERRLLEQFKGVGSTGAEIFLREVQGLWGELYPFADAKVTSAAKKLELPSDPQRLARLVPRSDFPRLVTGILRIDLTKQHGEVLAQAV